MSNYKGLFDALRTDINKLTPVQWAEANRVLTKDISRYYGKMSYKLTPYLIEVANSIMQSDPAEIISIMKGSQLGFSIGGIFTQMGWVIDQDPANILFITETEAKIKDQVQGAINQMINSSGLSTKVGNHNLREREAKGRRSTGSGDTTVGFTFNGGKLYTWSGQKVGSLSSWSIKYGFYDEVERWKGTYKDAGSFMKLVEPRHKSFGKERKLIFISTPELKHTSNIEPLYLKGDQRRYYLPCKKCGEFIEIKFEANINGEKAGIVYDRDANGKYKEGTVGYVCTECGSYFKESHKFDCYEDDLCIWKPTATPESYMYKSYQISSLYAPLGFYSWDHIVREWCEMNPINGVKKTKEIQGFVNQTLGLTFEDDVKENKSHLLRKNHRNYDVGIVPFNMCKEDINGEIILLTCSVDLNGVMGDNLEDDDVRLDYEVVAWTTNGDDNAVTSYSIDQGSIGNFRRSFDSDKRKDAKKFSYRHGVENSVWDVFENEVLFKNWEGDNGQKMRIMMCGVDTGHFTIYANEFVNKHVLCIALKGGDENEFAKYHVDKKYYKKGSKNKLYIVDGNRIKDLLAETIQLTHDIKKDKQQPQGFMNFPLHQDNKYNKDYFKDYEGEIKKICYDSTGSVAVGYRWEKKTNQSSNHFYDVRVYNIAVQKIFTEIVCKINKVEVNWVNCCLLLQR